MSNSKLVNVTMLSPNFSYMTNKKNTKITIHHMAGNASVETCGRIFADPKRGASSNYGIGTDGRIALYVDESNRAWTSSSRWNDSQAVTIEVANNTGAPTWSISEKAMNSLIALCVDICQRNGIKRINFTGDKNGNLTMHKWFAPTGCPGPYLEPRFPWIADQINLRLNGKEPVAPIKPEKPEPIPTPKPNEPLNTDFEAGDLVSLSNDAVYITGAPIPGWVKRQNWYVSSVISNRAVIDKSESGKNSINSVVDVKYLRMVRENDQSSLPNRPLTPGQKFKLRKDAKYTNGKTIPKWVISSVLYARSIRGSEVVFSILKIGPITGIVDDKYIIPLGGVAPSKPEIPDQNKNFLVRVVNTPIQCRVAPSASSAGTGIINSKGVYTIVEEKNGWGKLKSGAGWIELSKVEKI